jgi:hypothetical protein
MSIHRAVRCRALVRAFLQRHSSWFTPDRPPPAQYRLRAPNITYEAAAARPESRSVPRANVEDAVRAAPPSSASQRPRLVLGRDWMVPYTSTARILWRRGWAIRRAAWMTQVMSPQVTNQLALSAFIEPDPERLFHSVRTAWVKRHR